MPTVEVNYMAVLAAAAINMVIGFVWYSMPLFGKQWLHSIGKKPEDISGGSSGMYALSAFGALVMAYVLSHIIDFAEATTVRDGASTGFWIWLGFVATTYLSIKVFESRSWEWYLISTGYYLVTLVVTGMLLAVWV